MSQEARAKRAAAARRRWWARVGFAVVVAGGIAWAAWVPGAGAVEALLALVAACGVWVALQLRETREALVHAEAGRLVGELNPHTVSSHFAAAAADLWSNVDQAEALLSAGTIFLTHRIASARHEWRTLGEERALVEAYLDVERLRMRERLWVEWEWDAELDREMVPAVLLQPLVENAIRHAIRHSPVGGSVRIIAERTRAGIRVGVRNQGDRLGPLERPNGTGIHMIRRRLWLLYGDGARLTVSGRGGYTFALVELPA